MSRKVYSRANTHVAIDVNLVLSPQNRRVKIDYYRPHHESVCIKILILPPSKDSLPFLLSIERNMPTYSPSSASILSLLPICDAIVFVLFEESSLLFFQEAFQVIRVGRLID
jgi:hypothetical protein